MKNKFFSSAILILSLWSDHAWGQASSNQNYIRTTAVLESGITSEAQVNSLLTNQRQQQIVYYDGLGRPIQQIQVQASPNERDLVTPLAYDTRGRTAVTYLPYASGSGGAFQDNAINKQVNFYQPGAVGGVNIADDTHPFAQTFYEGSPLSRITQQGAPGTIWQPNAFNPYSKDNHAIRILRRSNYTSDNIINFKYNNGAVIPISINGNYSPNSLSVIITTDENGAQSLEFKDKENRTLIKKSQIAETKCNIQTEYNGNLDIIAPTGFAIIGIQSATFGHNIGGNTCEDIIFDCSEDITTKVQNYVSNILTNQTQSISIPTDTYYWGDPCVGSTKTLRVSALYAPINEAAYAETYYIYDDFSLLRTVIQPNGTQAIQKYGASSIDANFLRNWCFQYNYDSRRRVIEKYIPSAGWSYMVYNQRDQVVFTQDQRQSITTDIPWWITKYDGLGRPIMTAYAYLDQNRSELQATLDQTDPNSFEQRLTNGLGYTLDRSYPALQESNVLTITFYDDYNYPQLINKTFIPENDVFMNQVSTQVRGQVTGKAERVLSGNFPWLTSITFYDKKYHAIQVQSDQYPSGNIRTTTKFNFASRPLNILSTHNWNGTTHNILNRYAYDNNGRLLRTYQQMEYQTPYVQPEVLVAYNEYNETGQLVDKKLHSYDWNGIPINDATFLQSVDYRYNIRGWLTNINNRNLASDGVPYNGADPNVDDLSKVDQDLFGMELMYNSGQNLTTPDPISGQEVPIGASQYNGNIAEVMWKTRGDTHLQVLRGYAYHYDKLNRITGADYRTYDYITTQSTYKWTNLFSDYSVPNVNYDLNGNIKRLERKGQINNLTATTAQFGYLDKLTYTYEGNKLTGIDEDVNTTTTPTHDFEDNGHQYSINNPEYRYDASGNLTADDNKGISNIYYNILNLPEAILFSNGQAINLIYTASGKKLRKTAISSNYTTKVTDYVNGFVYEDNNLLFAPMPEGRVIYSSATGPNQFNWKYEYHLKDHLGNLRFAFRDHNGNQSQITAGMEPVNASEEEREFEHIFETRYHDNQRARTGNYVARLSAADGLRVGPSISRLVHNGDSIKAEVYGRYDHNKIVKSFWRRSSVATGSTINFSNTALNAPDKPQAKAPRLLRQSLALSLALTPATLKNRNFSEETLPAAFLKYELFDQDSQLVATRIVALEHTNEDKWQHMETGLKAEHEGYVKVSLVNNSSTPAYFDDLLLRPVDPYYYQENHYDPFGLNLAGIENESATPKAKFQYNGKEKQEEANLLWSDYGARMYDSQIGRWPSTDPLSEQSFSESPYTFSKNNPIRFIDPDGMAAIDPSTDVERNKDGSYTVVGAKNDGDNNIYVRQNGKRTGEVIGTTMRPTDFMTTNDATGAFTFNAKEAGVTFRLDHLTISGSVQLPDGSRASIKNAGTDELVNWGQTIYRNEMRRQPHWTFYGDLEVLRNLARNGGALDFKVSLGLNEYTPVRVGGVGSNTITTLRAVGNIAFGSNMEVARPIYLTQDYFYEKVMQQVGEYNQTQNHGNGYNAGHPFYGEHTYSGSYIHFGYFNRFP